MVFSAEITADASNADLNRFRFNSEIVSIFKKIDFKIYQVDIINIYYEHRFEDF